MKLYSYSVNHFGRKIDIEEIEVEEKEKIYIVTAGRTWRAKIKKSEIGELLDGCDLYMYLTERDNKRYINALIEYQERSVSAAQARLTAAEIKLENYKNLLEKEAANE